MKFATPTVAIDNNMIVWGIGFSTGEAWYDVQTNNQDHPNYNQLSFVPCSHDAYIAVNDGIVSGFEFDRDEDGEFITL